MNKQIIIFITLFIISLGIVTATNMTTDLLHYYTFDNDNLNDSLNRSNLINGAGVNCNSGSVQPSTNTSGIINDGRNFSVCHGMYNFNSLDGLSSNSTINMWVRKYSNSAQYLRYANDSFTSTSHATVPMIEISYNPVGTISYFTMQDQYNNCSLRLTNYTVPQSTGNYYMISVVRNVTHIKAYLNATLIGSGTCQNQTKFNYNGSNQALMLGFYSTNQNLDELAIYNRSLNQTELNFLFANGTPTSAQQYPFMSSEIIPYTTGVNITQPCNVTYTIGTTQNISVDWTNSTTNSNYTIQYTLYYNDTINDVSNDIYIGNDSNFTWSNWQSEINVGTTMKFYVNSNVVDTGNESYENITVQECEWYTCENSWVRDYNQTCTNNTWTIVYVDENNCPEQFNIPVDNGTTEECGCIEVWNSNNTACNGYNYTIQYYDVNNCNTTNTLPIDNGSVIPCTINCNWQLVPSPCVNNLRYISYNTTIGFCTSPIPSDNNTYVDCAGKTLKENFTLIDLIFIILIALTFYTPFYMNDKRWQAIYAFTGLLLAGYTLFLTNNMMRVYTDNTLFVWVLGIILYGLSVLLLIIGVITSISLFSDHKQDKYNRK